MTKISPVSILVISLVLLSIVTVHGQVTARCTASMLSSVSPCMSFLTNSSSSRSSPTAACCSSLKSVDSGGMNCLCLIVTGGVPFSIPINRTLAVTLPRACNLPGVPIQCKASSAPVPAPGPISIAPTLAPESSPSPSASLVPKPTPSASTPESQTVPTLAPPSTTEAPTTTSGRSPTVDLSNSAAFHTITLPPAVLISAFGFLVCKFY